MLGRRFNVENIQMERLNSSIAPCTQWRKHGEKSETLIRR